MIIVKDGLYTENINENKTGLTICSENGDDNCIFHAKNSNKDVFYLSVNYVNISGFKVTGATGNYSVGISGIIVNYCNISYNVISNNDQGIWLVNSFNNIFSDNKANFNKDHGIYLM